MIRVENVSKTFVLHQQNGVRLPVLQNATLEVKTANAWCCTVTRVQRQIHAAAIAVRQLSAG